MPRIRSKSAFLMMPPRKKRPAHPIVLVFFPLGSAKMEKFIYNLIPDKRQPGDFVRNGAYFYLSRISKSPNAGEGGIHFNLPCRKGKTGLYRLEEVRLPGCRRRVGYIVWFQAPFLVAWFWKSGPDCSGGWAVELFSESPLLLISQKIW